MFQCQTCGSPMDFPENFEGQHKVCDVCGLSSVLRKIKGASMGATNPKAIVPPQLELPSQESPPSGGAPANWAIFTIVQMSAAKSCGGLSQLSYTLLTQVWSMKHLKCVGEPPEWLDGGGRLQNLFRFAVGRLKAAAYGERVKKIIAALFWVWLIYAIYKIIRMTRKLFGMA